MRLDHHLLDDWTLQVPRAIPVRCSVDTIGDRRPGLIPTVELSTAILLALNVRAELAVTSMSVLLVGFTVLTTVSMQRGNYATCGCFPFQEPQTESWYFIRNGALLAMCLVLWLSRRSRDQDSGPG